MIFLNISDIIVNNKYKQLFIFHQFDGVKEGSTGFTSSQNIIK